MGNERTEWEQLKWALKQPSYWLTFSLLAIDALFAEGIIASGSLTAKWLGWYVFILGSYGIHKVTFSSPPRKPWTPEQREAFLKEKNNG